jgi:hypothetical protein
MVQRQLLGNRTSLADRTVNVTPARLPARVAEPLAIAAIFLAASVLLQGGRGALSSGLGAHEDEAAHYVTGVMLRDLVAGLSFESPVAFAEQYYTHYPRVAVGQWPPVFHLMLAVWTLPFGPGRLSVLLLMMLLASLVGLAVYGHLKRDLGRLVAALFALLLLSMPLVQVYQGAVMTEIPMAAFCLGAVCAFARYLETGRVKHTVLFTLFAILAVMTKGSGLAVALVPPVAVVLSRRWDVLRRPGFWWPAVLVALVATPWYLLTAGQSATTWVGYDDGAAQYAAAAAAANVRALLLLSPLVAPLAMLGVARTLRPHGDRVQQAGLGLLVGLLVIHSLVPSSIESRHMVVAAPIVVLLAGAGLSSLRTTAFLRVVPRMVWATALMLIIVAQVWLTPSKRWHGYQDVVDTILQDASSAERAVLIASESLGNGVLISEMVMRDTRPGRIVLRGEKVLSRTDWLGDRYELIKTSPSEVLDYLRSVPVRFVVVDTSVPPFRYRDHHRLLTAALRDDPGGWSLVGSFDAVRDDVRHERALRLYRRQGLDNPRPIVSFAEAIGRSP